MRGRELKLGNLSEKEKGYLFGLFEGDGYKIYEKKNRHYDVEWYLNSVKDKPIINFLVILLKKIGINYNLYQDKRYNCKRVRVYSKELFNWIDKDINIKDKSKEFNLGFISGLIDSEGYVNSKKDYIMVINTNKRVLEESQKFLKSVGINSSIMKRKRGIKDKLESYRMYLSVSFKNTANLSIKTKRLQL